MQGNPLARLIVGGSVELKLKLKHLREQLFLAPTRNDSGFIITYIPKDRGKVLGQSVWIIEVWIIEVPIIEVSSYIQRSWYDAPLHQVPESYERVQYNM